MNDNWSDFEKYVFGKLETLDKSVQSIDKRLTSVEVRAAMIAFIVGISIPFIAKLL